jgi:uncharacterized protein with PIN domain
MGLKGILSGSWFTRLVMISWIICAIAIFVLFKNMELIVHGQLYYYGLVLSPDWADPYRIYTWLIYICLGLPTALSGIALISSFLKVEKVPEKRNIVPQRTRPPQGNVKLEPRPPVREAPRRVESCNSGVNGDGITCPQCKKVFGRALVMLDFRSGKNRMVSVCPYCNHVLGYTSEERSTNEKIYVARPDEKLAR